MWCRKASVTMLEKSISQTSDRVQDLTTSCRKHDLSQHPTADACPCQVKLIWELDRLDESIHRLKVQKCSVGRWFAWYLWSSSKNPGFPKESIDCWKQTEQPRTAWQKYGVAKRNGTSERNSNRGYLYYKNGRVVGGRPAAAPSGE